MNKTHLLPRIPPQNPSAALKSDSKPYEPIPKWLIPPQFNSFASKAASIIVIALKIEANTVLKV